MPPPEHARWFTEILQPHESALRAYLLRRFPALPDHDDLIQETYLRVLRTKDKVREGCARAYLLAIAHNVALDLFRHRRAAPYHSTAGLEALPVVADIPDAADLAESHQRHETLFAAVAALPPRCRAVMMLRYIDGLSRRDIAARLGLSEETVKVHLAKGVRECIGFFSQRGMLEQRGVARGRSGL